MIISEKAFQQAYKAAKIKAQRLPEILTSHDYSDEELEILKQGVYRVFLETYLEFERLNK